jgi:putative transposase
VWRKHGLSEASYYLWRSKFGDMRVSDAKRLKELETENTRLKKLLAEQMLENGVIKDVLRKKIVGAPARQALVRQMIDKELRVGCLLRVVGMSASAYRYHAQPDRNVALRRRIVELAQRHKRDGVGMIHLKLRREGGEPANYKRVKRLYREEWLQARRRKRKKVPLSERQPLCRPSAPNEVADGSRVRSYRRRLRPQVPDHRR